MYMYIYGPRHVPGIDAHPDAAASLVRRDIDCPYCRPRPPRGRPRSSRVPSNITPSQQLEYRPSLARGPWLRRARGAGTALSRWDQDAKAHRGRGGDADGGARLCYVQSPRCWAGAVGPRVASGRARASPAVLAIRYGPAVSARFHTYGDQLAPAWGLLQSLLHNPTQCATGTSDISYAWEGSHPEVPVNLPTRPLSFLVLKAIRT
ncbi:hypothetical protein FKP32DRAFT_498471 [Trametes sanguinea]|nr:hypothetical protein FKP32DRAFT_498471 [Trametes sanguinea]